MKWWQRGIALAVVVLASVLWVAQSNSVPDANTLTLSAARQMQAGYGAIFPTIEPQAATYPLTPTLLLMTLSLVGNPNVAITLLALIAAIFAAYFLTRVTDNVWTGATFLLATSMVRSLPECVMLAFALASLFAAKQARWSAAGVLMALAITAHPAAIILALLVAIWTWQAAPQAIWQYVVPMAGISAVFIYAMTAANGLWTLIPVETHVVFALLLVASVLYLLGDKSVLRERPLHAILLGWSVALLAISALTMQLPTLIIVPGLLAFASLRYLTRSIGLVVLVLDVMIVPFLATVDIAGGSPSDTVAWLAANTTPQTTIATGNLGTASNLYNPLVDIGSAGAASYLLNRPLIDLSSLLAPPTEHRKLSDPTFFVRYAPDVVVISGDVQQVAWSNFPTTYANTFSSNGYGVYQRVVNFTTLDPHPVEVVFNGNITQRHDLTLKDVGIADAVHPSDLVRVRLTWALTYNPSFEMQMRVMLVDAQGKVIANTNDKFAPEFWQSGERDTYHLLPLPADLADGALTLRVGIGIRDGDLGEHEIVTIQASKPQ